MSSEVALIIGRQALTTWTAYELAADWLTPADSWSVQLANPSELQFGALQAGQAVTLLVDGVVVLRGTLDRRELRRSASGGTLVRLGGRDLAGGLVDSSPPVGWVRRNITLAEVARLALGAVGSSAEASAVVSEAGELLKVVKAEAGESWWSMLERYARRLRISLHMTGAGVLELTRPDYDAAPVGAVVHLRRGDTNVLEALYADDIVGRFAALQVVGQAAGDDGFWGDAVKLRGEAEDAALKARDLKSFTVLDVGELRSSKDARQRAEWEVGMRHFRGERAQYVVRGHHVRPGTLWAPGQMVTLRDELAGLTGAWWLAGVRMMRDSQSGTRTALTLHPAGLFLPPGGAS